MFNLDHLYHQRKSPDQNLLHTIFVHMNVEKLYRILKLGITRIEVQVPEVNLQTLDEKEVMQLEV